MKNWFLIQYFIFFIVACIFIACNNKNIFTIDVNEIDCSFYKDTLIGKQTNLELMGADEVICHNNYLLVLTGNPKGQLCIYDINKKEVLANICSRGRAKNEFISPISFSKQIYEKNDHVFFPLYDNRNSIKVVDITESVKSKKTIIAWEKEIDEPLSKKQQIILDNTQFFNYYPLSYDDPRDFIYEAPFFTVEKDGREKKIGVFGKVAQYNNPALPLELYNGLIRINPSCEKIIYSLGAGISYMFLFNVKRKNVNCFHQKDALTFDGSFPDNLYEECRINAYDASVSDNYIVTLSADSSSKDLEENRNSFPVIRFYTWDGFFLGGAVLGQKIHSIAFDEINGLLWGLDRTTEKIYSFNVKGIYGE